MKPIDAPEESLRTSGKLYELLPGALSMFVGTLDESILGDQDPRVPASALRLPTGPWRFYVSKGLESVDQREIAVALAAPESGFPCGWERDVIRFLCDSYHRAKHGRFNPGSIIIMHDFCGLDTCGLALFEPPPNAEPLLPDHSLLGLLFDDEECAAAEFCGPFRISTWLGRSYRTFPYPAVCDPRRRSVAQSEWRSTVLCRTPHIVWAIGEASLFLQQSQHLILQLKSGGLAVAHLSHRLDALGADVPCGVIAGSTAGADAMLVWNTYSGVEAIAISGSVGNIIEGRFLLLGLADRPTKAMHAEDGFLIVFGPEAWRALKGSIRNMSEWDCELAPASGSPIRQFSVRFVCQ
jgi:hypothetical protein